MFIKHKMILFRDKIALYLKNERDIFIVSLFSLLSVYFFLPLKYRPENCDDGWSLSIAYNYINNNISDDIFFGAPYGVHIAGKTFAWVYGSVLNVIGWSKLNGILLSTTFVMLGCFLWYFISLKITKHKYLSLLFAMTLPICVAMFGVASVARLDALTFFLVSLSTFAFFYKKPFFAGLFAVIAIENHPAGVIVFCYLLGICLIDGFKKNLSLKTCVFFGVGLVLGGLYFYLLHKDAMESYLLIADKGVTIKHFLWCYFFETKFYRNVPELLLFLFAVFLFFRKKMYIREQRKPALFMLVVLLGCLLIPRENFHYVAFVFPPCYLFFLTTMRSTFSLRVIFYSIICWLLLQYSCVYIMNKNYDVEEYLQTVSKIIPRDQEFIVLGPPNTWFAFKDRFYYSTKNIDVTQPHNRDIYIVEHSIYCPKEKHEKFLNLINNENAINKFSEFNLNGDIFRIYLVKERAKCVSK